MNAAPNAPAVRTVAVVGGAGYLGSTVCAMLLEAGWAVRSLDLHWFGTESLEALRGHPRFAAHMVDACDIDAVLPLLAGCDAVVALQGVVGDAACAFDTDLTRHCNFEATLALAEACRHHGIARFVFASSCSVYGRSEWSAGGLNESSPTRPLSYYANDKLESEHALRAMADDGFQPTLLRFATLFGWSRRMRFDLVVNRLTARACAGLPLNVHGGQQRRPFLHVEDAARAIARVLSSDQAVVRGALFNIGSNAAVHRIVEVAEQVRRQLPGSVIDMAEGALDLRDYDVDFSLAARVLGLVPQYGLADGIANMARRLTPAMLDAINSSAFNNDLRVRELPALQTRGTAGLGRRMAAPAS